MVPAPERSTDAASGRLIDDAGASGAGGCFAPGAPCEAASPPAEEHPVTVAAVLLGLTLLGWLVLAAVPWALYHRTWWPAP